MTDRLQIRYLRKSTRRRTGPVVFSIMRDERYHLPFFLDHYRNLGVADFLIYDDSSSDGTREMLLAQEDVSVITSDIAWGAKVEGEKRWTTVLKQTVPNAIIKKGWAIVADADEYLLLPDGLKNIIELVRFMEAQGNICAAASMVDFYPQRLSARLYPRDMPPMSQCRYFDKGSLFDWPPGQLEPQQHFAGIRARLLRMLEQHQAEEYRRIFGAKGAKLAKTWKIPLISCGAGAVVWNQHDGNVAPAENIRLAIAHHKFTPDLDEKISYALESKSYFGASEEYVFLQAALRYLGDIPLVGPESVKFENVGSLESAGHLFVD